MNQLPFHKYKKPKKKAKKVRRPKLRKISAMKKEAWRVFSEWVRRKAADANGFISCITCGARVLWKESNASHFIHGHSKMTFLDPKNVHASCIRCNLYLSGNLVEYAAFMQKKYGWDTVDALRELSKQIWKPSREELEQEIKFYKGKLNELDGTNPSDPNL